MRDSREKGVGMRAGSDPPPPPPLFQTLVLPRASSLACVASVSVWFRNKERPRNDEERTVFWPCEKWHPLHPILRAAFDSRSLFFAPKPRGKTCCTGYIQSGPVTDRKPETRCTTQKGWKTPLPPPPPVHPSKLKDQVGLNLKNAYDRNH